MERCRNHRREYNARVYTHLGKYPTENECIANYGISQGKSSLMIFDNRHANLKYKFGNRNFWATGYYVSTVGINTSTVQKYIREQEKQDQIEDSLSRKEYSDSFKGSR